MNVAAALPELIGDLSRFGARADRVEGLVESQIARYRPGLSDWLVLPWTGGFYLFSEDGEGQRRGREVVVAFLGPSVVSVETVVDKRLQSELPPAWKATGLRHASHLRLVESGQVGADNLLSRLEDMAASIGGRTWNMLEIRPTHSDLLRDFRLALLGRDDESARSLLDDVRLNGSVSAENLRYLRIEYLAAFGRWTEMRALPHVNALLQARRPRMVSERLLQMVWWTELVSPGHQTAQVAFRDRGVLEAFGPLLRCVRVPSTQEGRLVGFLTALADNDLGRQEAILDHADDSEEQARLRELASEPLIATSNAIIDLLDTPTADPMVAAFTGGRFSEVIAHFLTEPFAEHAALAVQAILDSGVNDDAARVLEKVRELDAAGELTLNRHTRRDLEDLERIADDACAGWIEWSTRLAADTRWADASAVARNHADSWKPVGELESQQVAKVNDALLGAVGGRNDDQLRDSLDVLCNQAASQLSRGAANDFCQVVLMLLKEQDNFSEMVRYAYLGLFAKWLTVGPSVAQYREVLDRTFDIWMTIKSPIAVNWVIGVLEAATDSPCPDDVKRTGFAAQLIDSARQFYPRASLRERVEIEGFAAQLGLPAQQIGTQESERDLWSELNGKLLGIYSLLPRASALLESRLAQLCSVGEVRGNDDHVDTKPLRSLAERADYLIVDTWHAAHQATAAIDAVRPREQQILPRQRGVTGFLRALEACLGG